MVSLDELTKEEREHLRSLVRPEDSRGPWMSDFGCLPKNDAGFYKVLRSKDADVEWVQEEDVHHYPWIFVNSLWTLEDGVPMEEITPDCFQGVNGDGVSLVVLDVTESVKAKKVFKRQPTIQCHYEGRWHFIYRLGDFLPGLGTSRPATYYSIIAFCRSVENLEEATGGTYIFDAPILNPFATMVWSKSIDKLVFSFADFRNAHLSPEEQELKRLEGKRRQREAGPKSGTKRKGKTTEKIVAAILKLKADGLPLDQETIAKGAGRGRRTVIRHWNEPEVKKARGE